MIKRTFLSACVFVGLGVLAALPTSSHAGPLKERLLGVERWIILLNNGLDPQTVNLIANSAYDMAVVDDIATLQWNRGVDMSFFPARNASAKRSARR